MIKLKNKFAIGCHMQWFEVEIAGCYIESVKNALKNLENRGNVIIDVMINMSQYLEKIDTSKIKKHELLIKFKKMISNLEAELHTAVNVEIYDNDNLPYTIANYRRDFNNKYCEKVDVLMWGETDSLIPKQTFEILDLLHSNNANQNVHKYVAFFGGCKMWDESWEPIEHNDFTDKPFIDGDKDNWWSLRYNMTIEEMNKINDEVTDLDVRVVNPYKFNGCGLIISSDVVKSGVNIPRGMMLIHEDTAFQNALIKFFDGQIPQFVFKNILLVHNRKHDKKREYVLDEKGEEASDRRRNNDWYKKVWKLDHHNAYNLFNQSKVYTWEDVFDE